MSKTETQDEISFLSIDQGGHASRALLFNIKGELIGSEVQTIETLYSAPDRVEHSPDELVLSIRRVVERVVETAVKEGSISKTGRIIGGLATQRSSMVCWDARSGEALSPVISWQDRRAEQLISQLESSKDKVRASTGLFLSAHYGASKFNWCLKNLDSVKQAYKEHRLLIGPLSSYISFQLLTERPRMVDPANASRTLLWNVHTLGWDKELLKLFSVPEEVLPACTYTHSQFGHIKLKDRKIPLELITGDQSAAVFAQGKPEPTTAYINIGSGAFVQRVSHASEVPDPLLESIVYADKNEMLTVSEGTVNGAGIALKWFAETWQCNDLEHQLEKWLNEISSPGIFINGVSGVGSPYWISQLSSSFYNESFGEGKLPEKAVAVVESIVFLIQTNLDQLIEAGPEIKRIFVSGGLTVQDGICQRLADLSRLPVFRSDQQEATAFGLAWLLSGRPSCWLEHQAGTEFKSGDDRAIRKRYQRWLQLMEEKSG